jgi:hypothetical protein
MANKPAVQVLDPRADGARMGSLAAIALGAIALGVALTFGLSRLARLEQTVGEVAVPPTTATRSETRAAVAARIVAPATPSAHATKLMQQDSRPARSLPEPRVAAKPQPTATPPVEPPSARAEHAAERRAQAADTKLTTRAQAAAKGGSRRPPKQRSFEVGSVAYVRCDGLERARERYPCPRDRAFEQQVWRTLERLPDCTAADPGRGEAEVRFTLRRAAAAPGVEIKSATSGPSLNSRAVSKCVSSKLRQARTRLRSTHTVVSFRFGLE